MFQTELWTLTKTENIPFEMRGVLQRIPHCLSCNFFITDFLLCKKQIHIKRPMLIGIHYDCILIQGVNSLAQSM